MNRIDLAFRGDQKLLSIYFSAGHPNLDDTVAIIKALQFSGVDMIEIGLPFSDPLADGPTIQKSSTKALRNGMRTEKLFQQLENIRNEILHTHFSFWLNWKESILIKRISTSKKRPLAFKATTQEIKDLIKKRHAIFFKSDTYHSTYS